MYEARQNKEKVSRTISQLERKNVLKPLQRNVIIKTTEYEKNANPPMEQLKKWLEMANYNIKDEFIPLINLLYNSHENYEFIWYGGQKEFIKLLGDMKTMKEKIRNAKAADVRDEVHMPFDNLDSRPLKYLSPTNSQHINTLFALKYLQVFVSLRLKTCRLYDKKDLSPALIIQFIGRPTEPQASLVFAGQQD